MQKITEARECSRIEHFGVDAGERRRRRRHIVRRTGKCSKRGG